MPKFIMPLDKPRITSNFGWRTIFGNKEWHQGVDFVSGLGSKAPIHAMADGVVSYASVLSTYGNVVRIKHKIDGINYETLYAHLSRIDVKLGQKVKQGDIVGIIGTTGRSTGIHLHAELHVNGFWSKGQPLAKNMMDYVNITDTPSKLKQIEEELTMSQYNTLKNLIDAQAKEIDELKKQLNDNNKVANTWSREAWDWGKKEGLTDGSNPRHYITREQVLTIIYRLFGKFIKK